MAKEEAPEWAVAVGIVAVVLLLASIGLVAAGGWTWFSRFLESAAPAWVQAVGSIAAIIATGAYVQWQHRLEVQRKEAEDAQARRRKLDVIVELARATQASVGWVQAQLLSRELVSDVAEGRAYLDRRVVAELGTLLSAIPLHELDDPTVVNEVLSLLHFARDMSAKVDKLFLFHREMDAQMFDNAAAAFAQIARECRGHYETLRERIDVIASK